MGMFSSIWNKYLGGKSTPWADISYIGKKVKVRSYNQSFVDDLKSRMGDLIDGKTDDEIVKLFSDRENLELEEPRLDVLHSGISDDGRIKMKLDWNQAFIRHLADNGIIAETEEEAIEMYLSLLVSNRKNEISNEDVDAAFGDINAEAIAELEEAARQIEEKNAERGRVRVRKKPRRRKFSGSQT
jgi:hypothetical protein